MKKILAALLVAVVGASLFTYVGRAGVSCSVPFTFQNNTNADATQVNSNFTSLITCLGNAASAGANSDITSLSGLSTPLSPGQGGSAIFVGGQTSGAANAQTLASTTPNSFTLTNGYRATFLAGFTNTGPTTLNVSSTGAVNVYRKTHLGPQALQGGEIVASNVYTVAYVSASNVFILDGETIYVGKIQDWAGTTAPAGYLLTDGSCVSQSTYPQLFAIISTTYGACGLGNFNLPDYRGRGAVMQDGASRITAACASSNTIGAICGNTSGQATVAQANLPNVNFTVSGTGANASLLAVINGSSGSKLDNGSSTFGSTYATSAFTAISGISVTGTAASGGSGTALTTLSGSVIANKIIRY